MSYAELITKEIETLSPERQAKVLAFVAVLKAQLSSSAMPVVSAEQERKRDPLAAFSSTVSAVRARMPAARISADSSSVEYSVTKNWPTDTMESEDAQRVRRRSVA